MARISSHCLAVAFLSLLPAAYSADWLTDGGDSRRNNWQKDEKILTPANVQGIRLLWKIKLDNEPRQMHSLLEPLVIGSVAPPAADRSELVIQAGVSDNVFALDAEKGELVWKKHFESTFKQPPGGRGYERALPRRHDGECRHRPRRRVRASTSSTPHPGTGGCTS